MIPSLPLVIEVPAAAAAPELRELAALCGGEWRWKRLAQTGEVFATRESPRVLIRCQREVAAVLEGTPHRHLSVAELAAKIRAAVGGAL